MDLKFCALSQDETVDLDDMEGWHVRATSLRFRSIVSVMSEADKQNCAVRIGLTY